jgi:hypothetical protein
LLAFLNLKFKIDEGSDDLPHYTRNNLTPQDSNSQTKVLKNIGFEKNQTSQSAQEGTNGCADNKAGINGALSNSYFITFKEANTVICKHMFFGRVRDESNFTEHPGRYKWMG